MKECSGRALPKIGTIEPSHPFLSTVDLFLFAPQCESCFTCLELPFRAMTLTLYFVMTLYGHNQTGCHLFALRLRALLLLPPGAVVGLVQQWKDLFLQPG